MTALLLSRLQFAFTISFHIIFPAFTIGLAAWLVVLEASHMATGRPVYLRLFQFWMKIFGVAFGLGVVSVMAFEFGTNCSVLSQRTGPVQGPLLAYESVMSDGRRSGVNWIRLKLHPSELASAFASSVLRLRARLRSRRVPRR